MAAKTFEQHLKAAMGVTVMDGGTGSEIGKRAPETLNNDCWVGASHLSCPEVVESVHADYLRAGAQMIITNTYASNRHCLQAANLEPHTVEANTIACRIAHQAREKVAKGDVCFVCGSISTAPPENAHFNKKTNSISTQTKIVAEAVESSNPTSKSWWPPQEEELNNFEEQATVLKAAGVDCIALEMVKDLYHGALILRAAAKSGLPVMLGITVGKDSSGNFCLRDDKTKPLAEQLKQLLALCPTVICVSVMHSPAEWCADALDVVSGVWSGVMGCYPNNGDASTWPEWNEGDLCPERFVDFARQWRKKGATVIGGCCGIGVEHIRALSADLARTDSKTLRSRSRSRSRPRS